MKHPAVGEVQVFLERVSLIGVNPGATEEQQSALLLAQMPRRRTQALIRPRRGEAATVYTSVKQRGGD